MNTNKVTLLFRPDALVREKLTGDYYIISWKTASTFGQYTINQIQTDMQSMSEVYGVAQANKISIEGVLYLFAVKGQRRQDDYLGFKTQDTPLAYCWKRAGVTPEEDEYAWKYKWATEEINAKTGKPVSTQLGKGFRKVSVWDNYPGGVKAWISALASQEITPRHINPFESIFPESLPVSRRADEIESWKRQVVGQELRVRQSVEKLESAIEDSDYINVIAEVLDNEFPQHTHNCYSYMSKCPFWECCFTPAVKEDPMNSGLYEIRVPNHPLEKGNDSD